MERRDLYDRNHKLTGKTITKDEPIPDGCYVQASLVFIRNKSGHFLIQKRSKIKNGMYATTGGHSCTGESSLQTICREVKEELGLEVDPKEFQLYYSGRSDEEQVFFYDYYVEKELNLTQLKLQKSEVSFVCWYQPWEVKSLFRRCKFMDNHYEEFLRLKEWLKNTEETER